MRIDRKKFAHLLIDKDMPVKELAEKTGVSRATISNIKQGKRCLDVIGYKVAEALGVDVADIIETEE
ncbi:hypothetical protein IMSAG049_00038 [Clostridiales bacterium]|nr:hypothetical protein IMSAG049_00038 [Clostridiales bacterium]